jgi:flagellin
MEDVMGLFVNTNSAALNAQRNLLFSSGKLSKSFARLSSGLRINTAGDDAAGLSISERFTSQIRGLNQAVRNANDAISLVQVAEGALQECNSILQRIRELSVQAASDVNTEVDRSAIQDEVAQLKEELGRIGNSTTFNQQRILDGSFFEKRFHVGMDFRQSVSIRIEDARANSLGRHAVYTGTAVSTQAIDSADDLAINGTSIRTTQVVDDTLSTTLQTSSAIAKAAAINDATAFTGVSAYANRNTRDGFGAIAGGTLDQNNFIRVNGVVVTGVNVIADDAGSVLVEAINGVSDQTGVLASIDLDGRVQLTSEDGRNIEVEAVGNGGSITGLRAAAGSDVVLATVTLHSTKQYQVTGSDEGLIGFTDDAIIGVSRVQSVATVDVSTRDGANLALLQVDRAIAQVSANRSRMGALQNRIESTITNLTTVSENAAAARSRILDADFAVETANLSRNQILQQAATTVLAQANAQPQSALTLLQ